MPSSSKVHGENIRIFKANISSDLVSWFFTLNLTTDVKGQDDIFLKSLTIKYVH